MTAPLVIFKAINDSERQQVLLQQLLADHIPVTLKMPDEVELELMPMSINSALQIKCQYPGNAFPEGLTCTLMMQFVLNNERYMTEVQVQQKNNVLSLGVLSLFHLQRRRNFRYVLPPNHPGAFQLKTVGERVLRSRLRLIDISTEGCAAETPMHLDIAVGDEVTGEIFLEGQKSILISAKIQNIRPSTDDKLTLGLEFLHTAQDRQGDIVQALTLMQRTLFLKRVS